MPTTSATDRRQRFRAILAGHTCVHPGSVHDAISARIAQDLGFELGMLAGSVASLAVLGAPDIVVLTLTEFVKQARRISRGAPALPLLVDADHGYGNALNAARAVQELETAGVAALTIEDTVLPTPYGTDKPTLLPLEESLGKVSAALAARDDPSLVVVGTHECCRHHRDRRRGGPCPRLRRPRPRRAVLHRRHQAGGIGGTGGRDRAPDHPGRHPRGAERSGSAGRAPCAGQPARPPALRSRSLGVARHAEGVAR